MLYSTLLYSTLLHSTLLYSTLLYSTLLYSLLYSTLLYSTLLYSTLLYSTLLYSTLLYSTLLYSTLLYSTLLYSTLRYCKQLYDTLLFFQYERSRRASTGAEKLYAFDRSYFVPGIVSTVVVLAKHIFETGPGKCSKCLWKSSYIFGYSFVGFLSKRNKMGIWLIYILYIVGRQSRMLLYFL